MRRFPIGDAGMYIVDTASWRLHRPVIRKEDCVNCGVCLMYCPVNSIRMHEGSTEIDLSYCKGCGICAVECPKQAIDWVEEVR